MSPADEAESVATTLCLARSTGEPEAVCTLTCGHPSEMHEEWLLVADRRVLWLAWPRASSERPRRAGSYLPPTERRHHLTGHYAAADALALALAEVRKRTRAEGLLVPYADRLYVVLPAGATLGFVDLGTSDVVWLDGWNSPTDE